MRAMKAFSEQQVAKPVSDRKNDKLAKKMRKMKRWRLIIRNVSFHCQEFQLRKVFEAFGTLQEVLIPMKKDGKHPGFGFVQFWDFKAAVQAMRSVNATKICNRPVAVDWAVPKDEYMTAVLEKKQEENQKSSIKKEEQDDELPEEKEDKKPTVQKKAKQLKAGSRKKKQSESSDDDSEEDSEEDDDEEGSVESDEDAEEPSASKKVKVEKPSDVGEGRTIFIRNLSFDTDEAHLKECFTGFGPLKYALICKYSGTDHSRGSGFVQFMNADDARKCLESHEKKAIELDGRYLTLCLAVSKGDAQNIERHKHEKLPKDNRNLHLLRVGLIRPGSKEAQGMSDSDAQKRIRVEAANRSKIKNLHVFVSMTRLCVHNIPKRITDPELKNLCYKWTNNAAAVINECRIMRDRKNVNAEGVAQSLGFAFVNFTQHEHALACLRALNNNAEVFGTDKRPIVEFSLENRNALNLRAKRVAVAKNPVPKQQATAGEVAQTSQLEKPKKFNVNKPFPTHMGPKIRHKKRESDKRKIKGNAPKGKKTRKEKRIAKVSLPTRKKA